MDFKKWLLQEMPVFVQKHPSQNAFKPNDLKSITNNKVQQTLEERLNKNTGHQWNIIFLEATNLSTRDYKFNLSEYMKNNGLSVDNKITFAKNSSTGHVLTPWMIMHTIAHAIANHYGSAILKYYAKLEEFFKLSLKNDYTTTRSGIPIMGNIAKFINTRSSRTFKQGIGQLDYEEALLEIITSYLYSGKVALVSTPETQPLVEEINKITKELIDGLVGQILIDFN